MKIKNIGTESYMTKDIETWFRNLLGVFVAFWDECFFQRKRNQASSDK
jgi:hypothetical protein